jgi:N-acetylneuraminate synthase
MNVKLIAEIGCNHKGELKIAKEMIEVASHIVKADVVKFQKRCIRELLTEEEYNAPHPNGYNSYGASYGEHRERLEFTIEEHAQLKRWCDEAHIEYSTSVWDVTSAKEIITLQPKMIKVPSACNLNKPLLMELITGFTGEIHLSLGMTEEDEIEKIVSLFEVNKRHQDLVIYSCTSGYPVAFEDVCLLEIPNLITKYQGRVKAVGFSGHHLGIAADIAALTLGATYIERHFTLDRTWRGTDHSASLEPDGFRTLCRDARSVLKTLKYKGEEKMEVERITFKKLKEGQIRW